MPVDWWIISSNINYKLIGRVIGYIVGNGHFGDVEIRIFMDCQWILFGMNIRLVSFTFA